MNESIAKLSVVRFRAKNFNLPELAAKLTALKATASRTSTPVTVEQLQIIDQSETSVLLLQVATAKEIEIVVGMVHLAIIYLEDRAHLGPICVEKISMPNGHGTPLMQSAIDYVAKNFSSICRIDLSNRPSHDLTEWYAKFGFVPRTNESDDPTTVYRLPLT